MIFPVAACGSSSAMTIRAGALAERGGTRPVYLSACRSRQAVSLSISVGARLPLFYSGIGRAILAGTPERKRREILRMDIAEFPDHRERME